MSDRRVGAGGPLGSLAAGFETDLRRLGYKPGAMSKQLELLDDLSQWLDGERIAPAELTSERVADFVSTRRREGRARFVSMMGMATLLGFLRGAGVIPEPSRPAPVGPTEVLLERYWCFLVDDRGWPR